MNLVRLQKVWILANFLIHGFCLAGGDLEFQGFTHSLVSVLVCFDLLHIIGCCLEELVYFLWLSLLYPMC